MKPTQGMTWLLLLLPLAAGAETLRNRFELERPLEGSFEPGQRGRVVITDDVFGQARSFPNDVRIFDAAGVQWPCFLYVPVDAVQTETIAMRILNAAWVDGPEPYLQFDVATPGVEGNTPVHNRLELITTGGEFVRRVEIFLDDAPAGYMASGYLIDISGQRDARNRVVRYPDSDASRLRVRIYPNARAADETFEIQRAYLHYQVEKTVEREPVGFTELEVDRRDGKEEADIHVLDIGQTDRPVDRIRFEISDASYARGVSVYGRNTEQEAWHRVGGGEIHALPDERNDEVAVRALTRYLKIEVYHYDDRPLDITAIHLAAVPRYLVFEAASAGPASLFFRAWDVAAPRFDLRERMDMDGIEALPVVGTMDTRPNSTARAQPWRKYAKGLAGLAVGAVSLLVVWVIVGMLRRQTAPGQDREE